MTARTIETIAASITGVVFFAAIMTFGFYLRHGVWVWEALV